MSLSKDEAKTAAIRACSAAFEPTRAALMALGVLAAEILQDYAVEAQSTEELFFAQFGLQHRPTAVSQRVKVVVDELEGLRGRIGEMHGPLPAVTSPLLDFLKG